MTEDISQLFWWMTTVAGVVWAGVTVLVFVSADRLGLRRSPRVDTWLIVGGGVVLPTVVLTVLMAFVLPMLVRTTAPPVRAATPVTVEDAWRIEVVGEQWWWRVRYTHSSGRQFELANELRIPVGERIPVQLTSTNVIHSFWVPPLAGKMDMIPGRITQVTLTPVRTGAYRGVCAEYCGTAHALMAFWVTVLERDAYQQWLEQQLQSAPAPATTQAAAGGERFIQHGCGACHTVRGTEADGVIGPDLTHVGSRSTLAAGTLPNRQAPLVEWISRPERVKPGSHMPAFSSIGTSDLHAIAEYLRGLR